MKVCETFPVNYIYLFNKYARFKKIFCISNIFAREYYVKHTNLQSINMI